MNKISVSDCKNEFNSGKFSIPPTFLPIEKRVSELQSGINSLEVLKNKLVNCIVDLRADSKKLNHTDINIACSISEGEDLVNKVYNGILDFQEELEKISKNENAIENHANNCKNLIDRFSNEIKKEQQPKKRSLFSKKSPSNDIVIKEYESQKIKLKDEYNLIKAIPKEVKECLEMHYGLKQTYDPYLLNRKKEEWYSIIVPTEQDLDNQFPPLMLNEEGVKASVAFQENHVSDLLEKAKECKRTIQIQEKLQQRDITSLLESKIFTPQEEFDAKIKALQNLLAKVKTNGKFKVEREQLKREQGISEGMIAAFNNMKLDESYAPSKWEEIQAVQQNTLPQSIDTSHFDRVLRYEVPLLLNIMPPENWSFDQNSSTYFWANDVVQFSAQFDPQMQYFVISSSESKYNYVYDGNRISLILASQGLAYTIDPDQILNKTNEHLKILNQIQNGWIPDEQYPGRYIYNYDGGMLISYADSSGMIRAFSSESPCLSYYMDENRWEFWPGDQPHFVPQAQAIDPQQLLTQSQNLANSLANSMSFSKIQPKESIYNLKVVESKPHFEGFKTHLAMPSLEDSQIWEKSFLYKENVDDYWTKQEDLVFNSLNFDLSKKDYPEYGILIVDYDPQTNTLFSSTTDNTFHAWRLNPSSKKWEIVK